MASPATILEVSGKSIAVGLHWRVLAGDSGERQEIRFLAEETGARQYVRIKYGDDQTTVGLFVSQEKKPPKILHSIAAIYAERCRNESAVALLSSPKEGEVLLIGVLDGAPYPGYETIGPIDQMYERALDFIGAPGNTARKITIHTDTEIFGGRKTEPLSLDDLLAGNLKSGTQLRTLPSVFPVKLLIPVLFLVAAYGYNEWLDHKAAEARKAQMAAMRQVNPNQAYEASLQLAFANSGPPVVEMLKRTMLQIGNWQTEQGGWYVDEIRCKRMDCVATWKRSLPGITYQNFLSGNARKNKLSYPADGGTISEDINLGTIDQPLTREAAIQEENGLPKALSILQLYAPVGVTFNTSVAAPFGLAGITNVGLLSRPPVKAGRYSISGKLSVLDVLRQLPPAFTVESMVLSFTSRNFTVEGNYYVM